MDDTELDELMTVFFTGKSSWQCNICGELVNTEADLMEEHLYNHTEKEIDDCRETHGLSK